MYVIRLPNGNLQVPQSAMHDGRIIGDAYVEIGPQDADYARLAKQAVTMDELERRRAGWAAGDEALRQEFLEFARAVGDRGWSDPHRDDPHRDDPHRDDPFWPDAYRREQGPWPGQATGPEQATGPDTE
jgi:hypothetical protein